MRQPTLRAPLVSGALLAALGALALAVPSCGVMSSADCLERAACPASDATSDGGESGADRGVAPADDASNPPPDAPLAVAIDAAQDDSASADGGPEDDATAQDGGPCDPSSPDCGNASCAGRFQCVSAVPSGWIGPVALFDQTGAGRPASVAPSCPPTPYPNDIYDGHANPIYAGACTCACGAATASCTGPTVNVFQDSQCGAANLCIGVTNVSRCTRACASSGALSAVVTAAPTPSGGSCPSSVESGLQPWSATTDWATTGRVCATTRAVRQGGCAANEVCADAPPPTFVQSVCVSRLGPFTCPAGYPSSYVYYAHGTDTRSCTSSCGCADPTGVTCSLDAVMVSASSSCSSPASLSTTIGQCNSNLAATGRYVTASVRASGGQCAPTGTASVAGTVTPDTPTTVCCTM